MWQVLQGAASAGVHGSPGHCRLQRKWWLGEVGRGTRAGGEAQRVWRLRPRFLLLFIERLLGRRPHNNPVR